MAQNCVQEPSCDVAEPLFDSPQGRLDAFETEVMMEAKEVLHVKRLTVCCHCLANARVSTQINKGWCCRRWLATAGSGGGALLASPFVSCISINVPFDA